MSTTYTDKKGYLRFKATDRLVHREIAYREIYLPNRDKYPLPFNQYEIHHKDLKKKNNHPSNLELKTKKEHGEIHDFI